jgi:uncharacterized membrane protein
VRLDIRLAIGALFTLLGILLCVFGFFSNPSIYARSLGFNVNLRWGMVLLVFGMSMLFLGVRAMFVRTPAQKAAFKDEKSRQ